MCFVFFEFVLEKMCFSFLLLEKIRTRNVYTFCFDFVGQKITCFLEQMFYSCFSNISFSEMTGL